MEFSLLANRIAFVQVKGSVLLEAMRVVLSKSVLRQPSCAHTHNNVSAKLISYKETKDDKFI
nr:hypothetical protein [Mycoplasmopsis bovis]